MSEQVIGVIDNAIPAKLRIGPSAFALLFTTDRVIVAVAETSMQSISNALPGAFLGNVVGTAIGIQVASKAVRDYAEEQADAMKAIDPETILGRNKQNFAIMLDSVSGIEMQGGGFWSSTMLKLTTTDGKVYKYALVRRGLSQGVSKELFETYVSIVRSALGDRLTVK